MTVVATPSAAAAAPQPAPLLSAQRLGGKVCLVTGGASGIGKAICIQLAREGAHVVVFDMRVEPREGGDTVLALMKAAREVEGIAAQQDLFVEGDVSTSSDVQKVMDATLSAYGRLDVLVNNAAKMDGSTLLETSEEECKHPRVFTQKTIMILQSNFNIEINDIQHLFNIYKYMNSIVFNTRPGIHFSTE